MAQIHVVNRWLIQKSNDKVDVLSLDRLYRWNAKKLPKKEGEYEARWQLNLIFSIDNNIETVSLEFDRAYSLCNWFMKNIDKDERFAYGLSELIK
jgi:hypothetical protein